MKITWFTVVVAVMAILTMAVFIQFTKIEEWKAGVLIAPFLVTVHFYRKRVCYQCQHQDCPFHYKSKGNLLGFWVPILGFFVVAIIIVLLYSCIP